MGIIEYIIDKKKLYALLLAYFDNENDFEDLLPLMNFIEANKFHENGKELKNFLTMLLKIAKNHKNNKIFDIKVFQIIQKLEDPIKQNFSNYDIFVFFKKHKKILLQLFENQIITFDEPVKQFFLKRDNFYSNQELFKFFYPEIKSFINPYIRETIGKDIYCNEDLFKENRKIGENDSYICSLIRQDSIVDFIVYVNKNVVPLSSEIKRSFFETNPFLVKNKCTTLIEYAAFFGSIQIFNYLRMNDVELKPSIWLYAIHSNNAELFHLLEELNVQPECKSYEKCFKEAIKCHHNEIAIYIQNNFLDEKDEKENIDNNYENNMFSYCFHYYNYYFFPNEFNNRFIFYYLCNYGYYSLVKLYLEEKKIDINAPIIIKNIVYINNKVTPLYLSAKRNNNDIVQLLLQIPEINIEPYAFAKCTKLTEISLPSSITVIKEGVFYECQSLQKVSFPESITEIQQFAFCRCSSLQQIPITSSITNIGNFAFNECKLLEQITLPDTLKTVGEHAFYCCKSLAKIEIPPSITVIEFCLLNSCTSLKEISLPSSIKEIGSYAFYCCLALERINIKSILNLIGESAFQKCESLKEISYDIPLNSPSLIKAIKNNTYSHCSQLKNIVIPPSVTIIERNAFRGCLKLTEITIPSSVEQICDRAFCNCEFIKEILIPSSVKTIKTHVFVRCKSLEKVTILSPIKTISNYTFYECTSLKEISIHSSIINISSIC